MLIVEEVFYIVNLPEKRVLFDRIISLYLVGVKHDFVVSVKLACHLNLNNNVLHTIYMFKEANF